MISIELNIKPLSVNELFKGRRFKTPAYNKYIRDCLFLLPKNTLPPPPYEVHFDFFFSSKNSDIDNAVKGLTDILCKKYNFDDREIYKMVLTKHIVPKGEEKSIITIKKL